MRKNRNTITYLSKMVYNYHMIKRKISKKILELSKKFPIISITGPRQSGKTTLIKTIFKNYLYSNLEDSVQRDFAKNDPKAFLAQNNLLVIDEAQRVPELFSYLQLAVDENKNKKVVISGSQNFLLSEKVSQSLAGRVAIFKLLPFSLSELVKTKYWQKNLKNFMFQGLYPRIYDQNLNPLDWYPNYLETYLERDVRNLQNIGNLDRFFNFVTSCAANTASIVNLTSLSSNSGISPNTARSWISILKQSYLIFTLPPFFKNINKQIRKSPKLFFFDTGLLCHLLNIKSTKELINHYLYGQIFENFVISEIIKNNYNNYSQLSFYYLRDKLGNEVDLVFKSKNIINLIEIKAGTTYKPTFSKGILYFQNLLKEKTQGYILYSGQELQKRNNFILMNWQKMIL